MIDELYTNLYKRITKNICRNHYLWEELHSEAILIIVEKNFNLSEIRNMKHFFSAIVWKTWHSNKFKKNFMRDHVQYIDNYKCDVLVEEQQEIDFTSIIKFLEQPPETENDYYVLVYYRNPRERYDRLIATGNTNTLNRVVY